LAKPKEGGQRKGKKLPLEREAIVGELVLIEVSSNELRDPKTTHD
jgi:hypothetical protein